MANNEVIMVKSMETPNGNGRVYPKEVMERAINEFKGGSVGELDHITRT